MREIKKSIAKIICAGMVFSLLGGCGEKVQTPSSEATAENSAESSAGNLGAGASGEAAGGENATDKTEEPAAIVGSDEELAKAFAAGRVENNGGWFVRAGNRVYYRLLNKRELERTTLWGNLQEKDVDAESELKYYDLDTRTGGSVGKVTATGKLLATTDGFVMSLHPNTDAVLISTDGSVVSPYLEGCPAAVSEDGRYLATTLYSNDCHIVYHDGKEAYRFVTGDENYNEVLGFAGSSLITMKKYYSEQRYVICSYDENGQCCELGDAGNLQDSITGSTEFEQMLTDGKDLYVVIANYDGTAHMLGGWDLFKAVVGEKDSLSKMETDGVAGDDDPDTVPKAYMDGNGRISFAQHLPGDLALSESTGGDLEYYDSTDHCETLINFFVSSPYGSSLYGDFLHEAVAFGNMGFALMTRVHRDELGDIGWRQAYDIENLIYYVIPFEKEDLDEEGLAKRNEYLDTVYSVGWGDGEFDYLDILGGYELYSYEAEGYHGYAADDDLLERLDFNYDESVTFTSWNKSVEKSATVTPLKRVDPSGEDIAFSYENESGDMHIDLLAHREDKLDVSVTIYYGDGTPGGYYGTYLRTAKKTGDPLEGLVADDILAMFRDSKPVGNSSGLVEEDAMALGSWVQKNIGKIPDNLREKGEDIGRHYEFWFGTDVGNNFDSNFPVIYKAYYTLKDYYSSGGNSSSEFYQSVSEENEFLGTGDPENIEKMFKDMGSFITDCNTIIRTR